MERSIEWAHRERARRDKHYPYTVIMHIYNEEPHLKHVFNAIERQTVEPLDVIVVDDGSTDQTPDIIHEYGYTHIHLNQKQGLPKPIRRANAFNKARKLALEHTPEAKYLLKVDGDSQIFDGYAEHTIEYMEKNPKCVACSGVSVRYIKTRDLNNGAVMYLTKTLPEAKPKYGWDRDIQLRLVSMGYTFHVIRSLGYGEMRLPTVSYSGPTRAVKNRTLSRIAELKGFIANLRGKKLE